MITEASGVRNEFTCSEQRLRVGAFRLLIALSIALGVCVSSNAFAVQRSQGQTKEIAYVCPMHSDVKSKRPGKCPKCAMALRAAQEPAPSPSSSASPESDNAQGSIKSIRFPDTTVYDQDGRKLRFYSDIVKGKTVAINFIFTTCTTICPPLTATFRRVQQTLGDRVGRDIALISISVDPITDVPERLKTFAAKFNAGPGWTFVTGNKTDIDALLRSLGAFVGDKNDHAPMALVGNDRAGYWTRTYGLAPAGTLAKVITDAASRSQSSSADIQVPIPGEASDVKQSENRVAANSSSSPQADAQPAKAKTPAEAAVNYFTNTQLLTQDNRQVRFFEDILKGKTVLINFMFTTCTAICPPMTANLKKVQDLLGDRVGRDISLISFSVDSAIDTPETLKKYAANFKAGPGWHFLTGKKENLDVVLRKLGGYVEDKNQHNSILLIGNVGTGEWMKMFAMSKPSQIADAVLKIANGK